MTGGLRRQPVPQSVARPRFPSPLIEPDVRISRIRLSDQVLPEGIHEFASTRVGLMIPIRSFAWPSGIASVAASGSSRALLGSLPIASIPCRFVRVLKPGPLPSTGITRFHRYYEPLRHPPKPTTHGGCWVKPIPHSGGLPVLPVAPYWHAVTHHPGEADRLCRPFATDLCQPSPSPGRVGLRVVSFGAASVFTRVTACPLADNLKLPPFSQAPAASLPPRPLG